MSEVSFDRNAWLTTLSEWQSPLQMNENVEACNAQAEEFGPMINHGLGFWRDAYIAEKFAAHMNAEQVRLLHPRPSPDFAIKVGEQVFEFEATEAMDPNRRRGDEYREALAKIEKGLSTVQHDPESDWLTPDRAKDILSQASKKKAEKMYPDGCGLVIYLNWSCYDVQLKEIIATFVEATSEAGAAFQSVNILYGEKCYRTWENGKAVDLNFTAVD